MGMPQPQPGGDRHGFAVALGKQGGEAVVAESQRVDPAQFGRDSR
jgi:hypothetical protein